MSEEHAPALNDAIATSPKPPTVKKKKKKSGSFGIFKAALFMLKKKNGNNKSSVAAKQEFNQTPAAHAEPAANNWTKLVDSMRPLHLQDPNATSGDESPPPSPPSLALIPPYSPSAASTSTGTMSKYASAQSLRDLYCSSDDDDEDDDEEDDPDAMFDALCGDDMIDAKADEFIARFYKQIQMQNSTATAAHHSNNHGRHQRGGTI